MSHVILNFSLFLQIYIWHLFLAGSHGYRFNHIQRRLRTNLLHNKPGTGRCCCCCCCCFCCFFCCSCCFCFLLLLLLLLLLFCFLLLLLMFLLLLLLLLLLFYFLYIKKMVCPKIRKRKGENRVKWRPHPSIKIIHPLSKNLNS